MHICDAHNGTQIEVSEVSEAKNAIFPNQTH